MQPSDPIVKIPETESFYINNFTLITIELSYLQKPKSAIFICPSRINKLGNFRSL